MPDFEMTSLPHEPRFEFVFEIALTWDRLQNIPDMPSGAGRGATYVSDGTVSGPRLSGRISLHSGADWALFRPDGVLGLDARYMIEADDGALILMRNRGYLAGRVPGVLERIQDWMFRDGPEVPFEDYYLRTTPTFEVARGKYDWLMRHVLVGIGSRQLTGNIIRYFAVL